MALVSPHLVYTWGHNRVGQLGYSNTEIVPRNGEGAHFVPRPRRVESLSELRVARVVAGWGHHMRQCRRRIRIVRRLESGCETVVSG